MSAKTRQTTKKKSPLARLKTLVASALALVTKHKRTAEMLERLLLALQLFKQNQLGAVLPLPAAGEPIMDTDGSLTTDGYRWLESLYAAFQPLQCYNLPSGESVICGIWVRNGWKSRTSGNEDFEYTDDDCMCDEYDLDEPGGMWICGIQFSNPESPGDIGDSVEFYLKDFLGDGSAALQKLQEVIETINARAATVPKLDLTKIVAAAMAKLRV